jgi:beta-carotene hydroxylase
MRHLLRRKNDWLLIAYQAAVYGLFATLFLTFRHGPLWFKVVAYPIAALLTQKYESPLHYATHLPLFRKKYLNTIHRLSWCIFPLPAVMYRREHFHHHRHNNLGRDQTTTLDASRERHVSVLAYVWRNVASTRGFWNALNGSERREAALHLGLCVALEIGLCLFDRTTTLVFWLPVSWLIAPAMNALFCYFGHVPGNPYSRYLASTYVPVTSRWQRLLCWLDFHNSAYHLTHHLFPGVHWSDLGHVQKDLEPEYQRRGSPRSLAFNSMIVLNPFALFSTIWRVNRARDSTRIESQTPSREREGLGVVRAMSRARRESAAESFSS